MVVKQERNMEYKIEISEYNSRTKENSTDSMFFDELDEAKSWLLARTMGCFIQTTHDELKTTVVYKDHYYATRNYKVFSMEDETGGIWKILNLDQMFG